MAIRIICGNPGEGKSLYSMHLLVKELRESERDIITNLAVKMPELNEYLQKKYPKEDLDPLRRVTLITDDVAKSFWTLRHDPTLHPHGVTFFLEEAHEFWNSRDWVSFHREAMHYLSQHRKLGDQVYPITQAPGNLDKQFRSLTQSYILVKNHRLKTYWIFKGADVFKVKCFYRDPTTASEHAQPFEWGSFHLDVKGLANCYDTAKGVGVIGSAADKGSRAKGIHIYWVFPIALAVASLIGLLPLFLGKLASHVLTSSATPKSATANAPAKTSVLGPPLVSLPSSPSSPANTPPSQSQTPLGPKFFSGVLIYHGSPVVLLPDGSSLEEADLRAIYSDRVVAKDGTTYWPQPPKPAPASLPLSDNSTPQLAFQDASGNIPVSNKIKQSAIPSDASGSVNIQSPDGRLITVIKWPPGAFGTGTTRTSPPPPPSSPLAGASSLPSQP